MVTSIRCSDVNGLQVVANKLLSLFPGSKIFLLSGDMGAGKTTFIQAVCKELGVIDVVNSPTFSIVNEYKTETGSSVFHFDLYRIKQSDELLDIGYEEYIYSDQLCFIEWPELALDLMPTSYVQVNIQVEETTSDRLFELSLHNS